MPEISRRKLKVTLDGQNLIPISRITSRIETKMREGVIFELVRLRYRPSLPLFLTPGQHTVVVQAQIPNYRPGDRLGFTRVEHTFITPARHERDEPDSDDPDDCDLEF